MLYLKNYSTWISEQINFKTSDFPHSYTSINKNIGEVFDIYDDDQKIGVIEWAKVSDDIAEIINIFFDETLRKKGYGRLSLNYFLETNPFIKRILLLPSRTSKKFWLKMGAKPYELNKSYLVIDREALIKESYEYSDINSFKEFLISNGLDLSLFGVGNAKTVEHLYHEIKNNECSLKFEDGGFFRSVEFVSIKVYYNDLYLTEEKQVFNGGRTRYRKMKGSVSEKIIEGENLFKAALRGVSEELNLEVDSSQLKSLDNKEYGSESQSYPGIYSLYLRHDFECHLNEEQFNSDGYVEEQEDKKTYFKWIKISTI